MLKKWFLILAIILPISALNACGSTSSSFTNTQWQWIAVTEGIAQNYMDNPEDFVLVFYEDGTFDGKVDCNLISGNYNMTETALSLDVGPSTMAECGGSNSMHDAFMGFLEYVDGYELSGNRLTLRLSTGSTTLSFKDGGSSE